MRLSPSECDYNEKKSMGRAPSSDHVGVLIMGCSIQNWEYSVSVYELLSP